MRREFWPVARMIGGPRAGMMTLSPGAAPLVQREIVERPSPAFARRRLHSVRLEETPRATVSVVIPALNEEASIQWVLEQIPNWVTEVVLVDGLSIDMTEAIARSVRNDIVVVHQRERGKGAALRAGFAAATGDIVAMLDADGSTDPRELASFVAALEGGADFVKGSRTLKGGGSVDFTFLRSAGNRGFTMLVDLLFGSRFTDLCYGYCAFWRRHLDALDVRSDGFEIETELVISAIKAGLRIREVPSVELPRRGGSSNLNAFRDGRRVLGTIFKERLRRDAATPPSPGIGLAKLAVPSVECDAWLPAGYDQRRGDRRTGGRGASYVGPERRMGERRVEPEAASTVYVATEAASTVYVATEAAMA